MTIIAAQPNESAMDNETKQDGIDVDKVDFDKNGMPEGLDDELLDGVAGGILVANQSGDCGGGATNYSC
jgi:hypothetical protein